MYTDVRSLLRSVFAATTGLLLLSVNLLSHPGQAGSGDPGQAFGFASFSPHGDELERLLEKGGVSLDSQSFPTVENVFIFVLDGLRASEGINDPEHALIPNIWNRLRPLGTLYNNIYTMGHSATSSGHGAILSGNTLFMGNTVIPEYGVVPLFQNNPSIFQYFREQTGAAAREAWMINGKGDIIQWTGVCRNPYYQRDFAPSVAFNIGTLDHVVYAEARKIISRDKPKLALINFQNADLSAHHKLWDSYVENIQNADQLIANLIQAIESSGHYAGKTAYFITTDHGRHLPDVLTGYQDHYGNCSGCREVFLLAIGPNIKTGQIVTRRRHLRDITPTIGKMMGLQTPHVTGSVMEEMFQFAPEPEEASLYSPEMASGNGVEHLAFVRTSDGYDDIYYQRRSAGTEAWSGAQVLSTEKELLAPKIYADGDHVAVVWAHYTPDGENKVVVRQSLDAGQSWSGPLYLGTNDPFIPDYAPDLVVDDGDVYVVWENNTRKINAAQIRGQAVLSRQTLSDFPSERPTCVKTEEGVLAVYRKYDTDLESFNLRACRFEDGEWLDPVYAVRTDKDSMQPAVAKTSEGFTMVWAEEGHISNYNVLASDSVDGVTWSTPEVLDVATFGAWRPAIESYGGLTQVAFESYDEKEPTVWATSRTSGSTWGSPVLVPGVSANSGFPTLHIGGDGAMDLVVTTLPWPKAIEVISLDQL
ncbi:MAG: sulfatase-like hydrolase/transferase [Opitutales bacterium]